MDLFRREGAEGLASTKAPGPPTKLAETQIEKLSRIIVGKNPRQLNFGPALWTLPIIGKLVERLFGVVLHQTTISRLLAKIGITPQKPVRRAFQRDDQECMQWMTEEFPQIVRGARRRQATLLFLDETGVHEAAAVGRTRGVRQPRTDPSMQWDDLSLGRHGTHSFLAQTTQVRVDGSAHHPRRGAPCRAGLSDGLVRLSAGIEHVDQLLADVQQASERSASRAKLAARGIVPARDARAPSGFIACSEFAPIPLHAASFPRALRPRTVAPWG